MLEQKKRLIDAVVVAHINRPLDDWPHGVSRDAIEHVGESLLRDLSDFFFNDAATTEIYTTGHPLSLHDALPISATAHARLHEPGSRRGAPRVGPARRSEEHTSELQSRTVISYAVFCLKKKNNTKDKPTYTSRQPKQKT